MVAEAPSATLTAHLERWARPQARCLKCQLVCHHPFGYPDCRIRRADGDTRISNVRAATKPAASHRRETRELEELACSYVAERHPVGRAGKAGMPLMRRDGAIEFAMKADTSGFSCDTAWADRHRAVMRRRTRCDVRMPSVGPSVRTRARRIRKLRWDPRGGKFRSSCAAILFGRILDEVAGPAVRR